MHTAASPVMKPDEEQPSVQQSQSGSVLVHHARKSCTSKSLISCDVVRRNTDKSETKWEKLHTNQSTVAWPIDVKVQTMVLEGRLVIMFGAGQLMGAANGNPSRGTD